MPFSKEQYQQYYQKIKEEKNKKRREQYLTKKIQVDEILLNQVDENQKTRVDENMPTKVDEIRLTKVRLNEVDNFKVDEKEASQENHQPKQEVDETKSKLWLDYYSCKKPYCYSCIQVEIKENEHVFCSEDLISFGNYVCLVKHWTIYQGHSYQKQPKNSLPNLPLLALTQQVMKGATI